MKKRKVLHICNYAAPYKGNFINSLRSLEKEEIENIYLFPHFAISSGAESWINELNCVEKCAYIQKEKMFDAFLQLKQIIKKHKVDAIVMHFSNLRADVLVKVAFKGNKVIRFFHNTYKPRRKSVHIIRSILWSKNIFVGVSEFVSNELKKLFERNEINTVVNAIDFERLDKFELIEKEKGIVLTMMGWDQKVKGVDLVIQAVNQLRNKYDIVLNIVTTINSDTLKTLIDSTVGEVNWINILPPRHDIATYYNASDIFVSASRTEAFGYSVVEAAYCGNKIVASRVEGQAELKIDGVYWFESENVDDLCKNIDSAVVDLSKLECLTENDMVKKNIIKDYSLGKWSKAVSNLLDEYIR